eukprot:6609436-Pyramimonas_sp.AAC.1
MSRLRHAEPAGCKPTCQSERPAAYISLATPIGRACVIVGTARPCPSLRDCRIIVQRCRHEPAS